MNTKSNSWDLYQNAKAARQKEIAGKMRLYGTLLIGTVVIFSIAWTKEQIDLYNYYKKEGAE